MKLILEVCDDRYYAYIESEEHYERVKHLRKGRRYTAEDLANECDLGVYDEGYFEFELKEGVEDSNLFFETQITPWS